MIKQMCLVSAIFQKMKVHALLWIFVQCANCNHCIPHSGLTAADLRNNPRPEIYIHSTCEMLGHMLEVIFKCATFSSSWIWRRQFEAGCGGSPGRYPSALIFTLPSCARAAKAIGLLFATFDSSDSGRRSELNSENGGGNSYLQVLHPDRDFTAPIRWLISESGGRRHRSSGSHLHLGMAGCGS